MQLRSLALPFTVLEWTLPTVPKPAQKQPSRTSSFLSKDHGDSPPAGASSPSKASSTDTSEHYFACSISFVILKSYSAFDLIRQVGYSLFFTKNGHDLQKMAQMEHKMNFQKALHLHW